MNHSWFICQVLKCHFSPYSITSFILERIFSIFLPSPHSFFPPPLFLPSPTLSPSPPTPPQQVHLKHIWQPLNNIRVCTYTQQRHTRDFPNPSFQISIIGRHNITLVLHHSIHQTVIGICTCMRTL